MNASGAIQWRVRIDRLRRHRFGFPLAVAIISAVLVSLHFVGLSDAPPGLYADEASMGYAGWSISLDGHDEHGVAWPLFFESFGEWKSPISIYLTAIAVKIFGLSIPVVRGVPSVLMLLAAALFGLLVWRTFRLRWLALGAFATAGVLPWFFVIGRTAVSEAAALPAILFIFLLTWRWAEESGRWLRALVPGVVLGLSAYSYATMRLFFLLLILALVAAYRSQLRTHGRAVVAAGIAAVAVYVPALIWNAQHPGALTARFTTISIFTQAGSLSDLVGYCWRVYTSAFSLEFWFQSGDPFGRHSTGHGGELYLALTPLIAWGLVGLWRRRREPFWRLIGWGLVLAPIPASLTADFSHSLRLMEMVPFLLLVAALGAADLWKDLEGTGKRLGLASALAAALLVEMGSFTFDYYAAYPQRVWSWFDAGLPVAVASAEAARPDGALVVVSDEIEQPALMYAYLSREDPAVYRTFGIAGVGALVGHLQGDIYPTGTVVIAKPDETVARAHALFGVWLHGQDEWGKPTAEITYIIWIVD